MGIGLKNHSSKHKQLLSDLHTRRDILHQRKRRLREYLEDIKRKYKSGEITYSQYLKLLNQQKNGKTIEQWVHYYHLEYLECNKKIIHHHKKLRNHKILAIFLVSVILLFGFFIFPKGAEIIGFHSQENNLSLGIQSFSENINQNFHSSEVFRWTPENTGKLTSLKISGNIEGEGEARIYLEDVLILDTTELTTQTITRGITGFVTRIAETPEETKEEPTQDRIEEATKEIIDTITETIEEPEEEIIEEIQKESSSSRSSDSEDIQIRTFTDLCEESCNLENLNFNQGSYDIIIEIEGEANIQINEIEYSITQEEVAEETPEETINEPIEETISSSRQTEAAPLSSSNGTFIEGFESNSYNTNSWVQSGTGTAWIVVPTATYPYAHTGNYFGQSEAKGISNITTNVSTSGYSNISFSFWALTQGLDVGEYIEAYWYNGTTWTQLMQVEDILTWTQYSYNLSSSANNNPNLQIRFSCIAGGNNEKCNLDDINVSGKKITDQTNPSVSFHSQTPADIGTNSLLESPVRINYTISDNVAINSSATNIYFKVNHTGIGTDGCWATENGTGLYCNWTPGTASSNASSMWEFRIYHDSIYPYNSLWTDSQQWIGFIPHVVEKLDTEEDLIKMKFFNISENESYNTLEVMAINTEASGTQTLRFYYCNESYTEGQINESSNCVGFYTLPAQNPYNHSHGAYSSHQLIPFQINTETGRLNGIQVTPVSYFILRGRNATNSFNVSYITNVTRTNLIQRSSNLGSNWSNFSGTVDAHIHQYDGSEVFYYYVCANDTNNNQNCSSTRSDAISLGDQAPSIPIILVPQAQEYPGNINITYLESYSSKNLTYYNITLRNTDYSLNKTILGNNGLNLSYLWDTSTTPQGEYIIRVEICDNESRCSYGQSDIFSLVPDTFPIITNVVSTPGGTFSKINWTTDRFTNSSINYGTNTTLGTIKDDVILYYNHSLTLTSLSPLTLYYYNVTSCTISSKCTTEGPFNFTTIAIVLPLINTINASPNPISQNENINITANVTPGDYATSSVWAEINNSTYFLTQLQLPGSELSFFEGLESNSFTTNNWTISTTGVANWTITPTATYPNAHSGSYYVQAEPNGGEATMTTSISTLGNQNLSISFWTMTQTLDAGEYLAFDYYDGNNWNNIFSLETVGAWTEYTYDFPSTADNNPNFQIRFRCSANANNEICNVDDINLTGNSSLIPSGIWNLTYNVTDLSGIVNYTIRANDTQNNQALEKQSNFTIFSGTTSVTLSVNQTEYAQGTDVGHDYEINIPFQAKYLDEYQNPISGATCYVINDETSDNVSLTYNASSGNYTGEINNYAMYGTVTFNVSCSKTGFDTALNSTSTKVYFKAYLSNITSQAIGSTGNYTDKGLSRVPPIGNVQQASYNLSLEVGVNEYSIERFYYLNYGNNGSLETPIEISGTQTLRMNLSINDSSCEPYLCLESYDFDLNQLSVDCANPETIPINTPTLLEQNITTNLTIAQENYLALHLHFNCSSAISEGLIVHLNYTNQEPNIEIPLAKPVTIDNSLSAYQQLTSNFTLGPNQTTGESPVNVWILFNNTGDVSRYYDFLFTAPIFAQYPNSIKSNSTYIYNSTGQLLASDNLSSGAPNQLILYSNNQLRWTTEFLINNTAITERGQTILLNVTRDSEILYYNTPSEKKWNISITRILPPYLETQNVTVWTNYSTYNVPDNFEFNVLKSIEGNTTDITENVTINTTTKTLTMPETNITSNIIYSITASDAVAPTIHLISPANNTETNQQIQNFSCNISNVDVSNLTLFVWNSSNELIYSNTTNLTGAFNQTSWNYTLPYADSFKWNCLGYDVIGISNYSNEGNYTIVSLNPFVKAEHPPTSILEDYDTDYPIILVANMSDPDGLNSTYAEVTMPNSTKQNISLYSPPQSDTFDFNTFGIVWNKGNSSVSGSQTCIADIATTVPGKAYTSISGEGTDYTDSYCSLEFKYPIYGDFDMNISFNITNEQGSDYAMLLKLHGRPSALYSSKNMFLSIGNWSGYGRTYDVFIDDGNTSEYVSERPTNDTYGKFRIKREGNNLTFYTWNNTNNSWFEEYSQANLDLKHALFFSLESESALDNWGNISVEWENLSIHQEQFYSGLLLDDPLEGIYNITFYAIDNVGLINNSETTQANLTTINDAPTTPFFLYPFPGGIVNGTTNITWSNVYDPESDTLQYNITLLNTDGSDNSTIVSNYGNSSTTYYPWTTITYPNGNYSLRITVFENNTSEGYSNSDTLGGNITINNEAPKVVVISPPLGEIREYDENYSVLIIANMTDSSGFESTLAEITLPNSTKQNLSLYLPTPIENFSWNSLGFLWNKENTSIQPSQTCIADITTTVPGKAYTSISGNGFPRGDAYCSLNFKYPTYGDFDLNVSFNITNENGIDYAGILKLHDEPSSLDSSKKIFLAIVNWSSNGRAYETFVDDGNTSNFIAERPTNDTYGKFRIRRQGNNFTFYSWNNTDSSWIEEHQENNLDLPEALFITLESASSLNNWGSINMTWDDLSVEEPPYYMNLFENTIDQGVYNVTFYAKNNLGLTNNTEKTQFNITPINDAPSSFFILTPLPEDILFSNYSIIWSQVTDEESDTLQYNITLLNPDGSDNSTIISNYGDLSTTYYTLETLNHPDGNYSLRITVFENDTSEGYSKSTTLNGNFSIDNTPPAIQFENPTEVSGTSISRNNILVNVSALDLNPIASIFIYLYNSTSLVNETEINDQHNYFVNFTNLPEGTYYFNSTAYDTTEYNYNSTETRNVTISIKPFITNIQPTPGTVYNVSNSINISATITDNSEINYSYINVSFPNGTTNQFELTNIASNYFVEFTDLTQKGIYNITFFANDSSGNINDTETTWFNRTVPDNQTFDIINDDSEYINATSSILNNEGGILTVELNISDPGYAIKRMVIEGYNENSSYSVITLKNSTNDSSSFENTFLIDLEDANLTSINITINATGHHLFKCTDFNRTSLQCYDKTNYTQIRTGLVPGELYTITLNQTDPIFGETIQGSTNTSDSYIASKLPTENYGGATTMVIGRKNAGDVYRGLIWFNLSHLPTGITITSANLSLYFSGIIEDAGTITHSVHKITQSPTRPWTELNATWNNYNSTNTWTLAGGDFNSIATDNQTFDNTALNSWIVYDVTSDIANFTNNTSTNFGWVIKAVDEATNNNRREYASSENTNSSLVPVLNISYFVTPVINTTPTITYVSPIPNTNPIEGSSTNITFYTTVYHENGIEVVNDTSVKANFTKAGEPVRENTTCSWIEDINSYSANYSCTINMWYFDEAGNWNVTVYAKDIIDQGAINDSTYFQYNQLQSIVMAPTNMTFNVSKNQINKGATNNPTIINNTGNTNLTNKIAVNAINLVGETNASEYLAVENMSIGLTELTKCSGTSLQNATDVNITGISLDRGNLSAGEAQEEIYYCINYVGSISDQTYSTQGAGNWLIKIALTMVAVVGKKKKREKKRKAKRDVIIDDLSVPITVLTNKLGGLEGLTKYLKENLELTYHEIAELLNRDDRTIWTAYNKAFKKQPTKISIKKTLVFVPISILKNRKYTILEAIVIYLKDKGIKYVDIAELLDRDQRNIWTIYSRAMKK